MPGHAGRAQHLVAAVDTNQPVDTKRGPLALLAHNHLHGRRSGVGSLFPPNHAFIITHKRTGSPLRGVQQGDYLDCLMPDSSPTFKHSRPAILR